MMKGYGKRILLVEDDRDIRQLLADVFAQEGYHVYEASNGKEALAEMEQRRFDTVLSDYHMPRMDGAAFLNISVRLWPETPVILASCDPDVTESHRPIFNQAFARLGKPFDLNLLLDTVYLASHRMTDRRLQETA